MTQPFSRWAGLAWMAAGLALYLVFWLGLRKGPSEKWEIKPERK
jgi:hypothetical protein